MFLDVLGYRREVKNHSHQEVLIYRIKWGSRWHPVSPTRLSEKHSFSTVPVSSNVTNEEAICYQKNVDFSGLSSVLLVWVHLYVNSRLSCYEATLIKSWYQHYMYSNFVLLHDFFYCFWTFVHVSESVCWFSPL